MPHISHPVTLAINQFGVTLNLRRFTSTGYVDGVYDETAGLTVTQIFGCIQEPSQQDMRSRVEGERAEGYVDIWTFERLFVADEQNGTPADEIEYDGYIYRIISVKWRKEADFCKAHARLKYERGRNL